MLRGFWRCDFPYLASRHCSSKTVHFIIITRNIVKKDIPYKGINIYIHIHIVCGIPLCIHNETNTYVFMINNNKTFYEHESLLLLLNSLSRDLNEKLDIHWIVSLWHCDGTLTCSLFNVHILCPILPWQDLATFVTRPCHT